MVFPGSNILRRVKQNLSWRRKENSPRASSVSSNESQGSSSANTVRPPEMAGVGLAFRSTPVPGSDSVVVVVRELVHGSSAHTCGAILPGDVLITVDGKTCENMQTFLQMPYFVLGPLGTEVRFQFRRGDADETFFVTLRRNMLASNQPTRASVGAQTVTSHLTGQIVEGNEQPSAPATLEGQISLLRQLYCTKGNRSQLTTNEIAQLDCFDCPAHGEEEEEEDDCAICLERMQGGDRLCAVPCPGRHRFHASCILKWLEHGYGTCPCDKFNIATALRHKSRQNALLACAEAERLRALAGAEAEAEAEDAASLALSPPGLNDPELLRPEPVEEPLSIQG